MCTIHLIADTKIDVLCVIKRAIIQYQTPMTISAHLPARRLNGKPRKCDDLVRLEKVKKRRKYMAECRSRNSRKCVSRVPEPELDASPRGKAASFHGAHEWSIFRVRGPSSGDQTVDISEKIDTLDELSQVDLYYDKYTAICGGRDESNNMLSIIDEHGNHCVDITLDPATFTRVHLIIFRATITQNGDYAVANERATAGIMSVHVCGDTITFSVGSRSNLIELTLRTNASLVDALTDMIDHRGEPCFSACSLQHECELLPVYHK